VRDAVNEHTGVFHRSLKLNTLFSLTLSLLNASMVASTGGLALYLWSRGQIAVGTVAMALPMSWQLLSMSGWVAWQVTTIFENIGVVQEGMMTIAQPIKLVDRPDATKLVVTRGEISFDHVRFNYGRVGDPADLQGKGGVLDGIDLHIRSGEKIGIVGRRRKVDVGQCADAIFRSAGRPYPDRRAGHRECDAGKPARADFNGDAGHFAAAPVDPR
jgi:ATP-binding cassette subfamily B multidrug efflux pump